MTQMSKPRNGSSQTKEKRPERERSAPSTACNGEPAAAVLADHDPWARASQVALVGLFVIAILWCAYVARPVIVPVVLAWVIATIVLPPIKWMQERGVPRVAAAIAVTFALALLIAFLLVLLSAPISLWLGRASEVGVLLQQKLQSMNQPLAVLEEIRKALNAIGAGVGSGQPALKVEQQAETMVTTIFAIVTPAVSQFVLCIGALVFYLVYQQKLRSAVVYFLSNHEARLSALRTLSDIDEQMTAYFGTFTIVNVCLGLVTVALTWVVGLPNPLLWGVLAGVLNYVPYLGPATVIGTLGVVGLLTFPTIGAVLVAPLVFLAIVAVEGQFLTPALMGRQLELNPFAVFLAIAFSTWLWGPVGAFVAVPLLMALTVALGHAFAEEKPELPE